MQELFERDKMRVEQKSAVKNSTIRFIVIALLFLLQVMWIAFLLAFLMESFKDMTGDGYFKMK